MTRYSRSVIPGRQTEPSPTLDSAIDNLVFGKEDKAEAGEEADVVSEGEAINFVERAASDRRRGSKRRGSDFAPLPGEAKAARSSEGGSKRGPILLAGALVIVGVFGVVVWNAYRDGVRPEDSAVTPQLADAGPFKSKPAAAAETKAKAAGPAEDSVFDQVEAKPRATPAPAPEVRDVSEPEAAPAPVQTAQAEPAKPAALVKAAPPPAAKPVAKVETAKAEAPKAAPPAPKPAQVAVATKQATPVSLVGGYSPAFASSGRFVVQIAAPSSEDGAIAEWNKGKKKAPGLFQSAERIIVQADVNGHTVYRLRAGSFATGADADAFCDAFKAAGGQCFRTAK